MPWRRRRAAGRGVSKGTGTGLSDKGPPMSGIGVARFASLRAHPCREPPMSLSSEPSPRVRRAAGAMLIGAAALSVLAMAHHPTTRGHAGPDMIFDLARIGTLSRGVHAAMIATVLVLWLALAEYSAWRGDRTGVRIALRLYGAGAAAMIGAALVNGFALDMLAAGALRSGPGAVQDAIAVLPLTWALNQALAGFSTFALCAGVAAWSLELWRTPGTLARTTAGYGVAMALAVGVPFALGAFRLDVAGMGAVVAALALWSGLVGVLMWRASDREA